MAKPKTSKTAPPDSEVAYLVRQVGNRFQAVAIHLVGGRASAEMRGELLDCAQATSYAMGALEDSARGLVEGQPVEIYLPGAEEVML